MPQRYATGCSIEGCSKKFYARGWCEGHYQKWRKYGDPEYIHERYRPHICKVEDCSKRVEGHGYCVNHRARWRKYGDPLIRKQAENGTGSITREGYRLIYRPRYLGAHKQGQVLEHRWVMAQALGRPLLRDEVVHHRNGDRLDNRIENLELWVRSHPSGQRVDEIVAWAREMLARYDT